MEGAAGPHQLTEGTMLDDKYRVERLLAAGGMGAVYIGTHIRLRKRVAIKVLSPQHASEPGIERFRREAITASQIGHEGIAQVTDLGISHDGSPFLVMEYLEGESLASRLRATGPLPIDEACEIGCAILSPLGAAHLAGIVHRDLKPDNVFLVRQSRGETVKLLDFGISRVAGVQPEFRLTMTGLVLGTPLYMSPEQARGESHITTAADMYAFGVILYEMLIGEVPIVAENYNQLMYRVTMSDFRPPRQRRPTLPAALEEIIMHAMAQVPADRPSSAIELEHALLPFCRQMFREQASARFSAPALSLKTGVWASARSNGEYAGTGLDPGLFDGTTLRDSASQNVHPPDDLADESAAMEPSELQGALVPVQPVSSANGRRIPTTAATPRRWRTPGIAAGIAMAVVGVIATGALAIGLADDNEPAVSPAPAIAVAAPPAHVAVIEPVAVVKTVEPPADEGSAIAGDDKAVEATTIKLRLAVDPAGAAVTLDGVQVKGTEVAVAKDGATHRLRITAAGYFEYDEAIRFDESQRLIVQLKPLVPPRIKDYRKERVKPERPERPERIESRSPYE